MPRIINVPTGSSPYIQVETTFGIFSESSDGPNPRITNISGIQTVVKLSGSGGVGNVEITLSDYDNSLRNVFNNINVHKTKASVYQMVGATKVLILEGEVTTPFSWDTSNGTVIFNITSIVESEEIGFSIDSSDFPKGTPIPGLITPDGEQITEVPSTLNGKAWPLVFGSCIHVPAVGYTLQEDVSEGFQNRSEKKRESTVVHSTWRIIEPSDVLAYEKAVMATYVAEGLQGEGALKVLDISSTGKFDPNLGAVILTEPEIDKDDDQVYHTVNAIIQMANARDNLANLDEQIFKRHGLAVFNMFQTLFNFYIEVIFKMRDIWDKAQTIDYPKDIHATFENWVQNGTIPANLPFAGDKVFDRLQQYRLNILTNQIPVLGKFYEDELGNPVAFKETDLIKINLQPDHGLPLNDNVFNIGRAKIHGNITNDKLLVQDISPTYQNIVIVPNDEGAIDFWGDESYFYVNINGKPDGHDQCDFRVNERLLNLENMYCYASLEFPVQAEGLLQEFKTVIKIDEFRKYPKLDIDGLPEKDSEGNVIFEDKARVKFSIIGIILYSEDDVQWNNAVGHLGHPFGGVLLNAANLANARPTWMRSFFAQPVRISEGYLLEVAPFIMPHWSGNPKNTQDEETDPILDRLNWDIYNKIHVNRIKNLPDIKKGTLLMKGMWKLPSSNWSVQPGTRVQEWGTDYSQMDEACGNGVNYKAPQEWVWIVNIMHDTVVKKVYAYREVNGRRVFSEVPSRYFYVQNRTIAGQECTVVVTPNRLTSLGEDWEDQLYITCTSPEGPNTSDILKWLFETYSDYTVDAASFADVAVSLTNYPSHFAILERGDLLKVAEDIAYQCRCAIYVSADTVYLKYLPKEYATTSTINDSKIIENSFNISYTPTTDLITKYTGLWKPNYQDLDSDHQLRPLRKVTIRNNIEKYGLHEFEREFWIYNIESLVKKSVTFWAIRQSNTWKIANFKTTLDSLDIEAFDYVSLDFPAGLLSDTAVVAVIDSIEYNTNELLLDFKVWTPVRAGELTPYQFAYLA